MSIINTIKSTRNSTAYNPISMYYDGAKSDFQFILDACYNWRRAEIMDMPKPEIMSIRSKLYEPLARLADAINADIDETQRFKFYDEDRQKGVKDACGISIHLVRDIALTLKNKDNTDVADVRILVRFLESRLGKTDKMASYTVEILNNALGYIYSQHNADIIMAKDCDKIILEHAYTMAIKYIEDKTDSKTAKTKVVDKVGIEAFRKAFENQCVDCIERNGGMTAEERKANAEAVRNAKRAQRKADEAARKADAE